MTRSDSIRTRHPSGIVHGTDALRQPRTIVPAEQMHPREAPLITEEQARDRGLVTAAELADMRGVARWRVERDRRTHTLVPAAYVMLPAGWGKCRTALFAVDGC